MNYAPENEMGVVFVFSHLARKLGYEIDLIRPGCPDCVAYRDGKRVRIEFEYRSSNFARHRHDPKKCDFLPAGTHAAGRGQGGDVRQAEPARPVTKPSERHEGGAPTRAAGVLKPGLGQPAPGLDSSQIACSVFAAY
jgi:hypothetical protein